MSELGCPNGGCDLLKFKRCVCPPYDEARARRWFLLNDPPIFRHSLDLASLTAMQIEQLQQETRSA